MADNKAEQPVEQASNEPKDKNEQHLDNFISQLKEMNSALQKQIDINLKKDEEIELLNDTVSKNDNEIDYRDKTIFKLNEDIEKLDRDITRIKRDKIFSQQKNEDKKEKKLQQQKKLQDELNKKQQKMTQEFDTTINIIKKGEKVNAKTLILTKSMVQEDK